MRKIYYFFGALIIIWFIVIAVGFLNNRKNGSQTANLGLPNANSLVLFYNKNIITSPPTTWQEFSNTIVRLKDEQNDQSVAAIGTADNVEYAPEILVLLMLEQGIVWPDFDNELGQRALKFYTQFADLSKKVYTWDKDRGNSLLEFSQGKISIIFAYEEDKEKFLNTNFGLVRFPVIDIGQSAPDLPELSESERAVLAEMIESVVDERKTAEEAISEGAKLIQELQ